MLHEVRLNIDHAEDDLHSVGKLYVFEHPPFVLVAWVRAFWIDGADLGLEHLPDDLLERDIFVMWACVVAPAEMEADLLPRIPSSAELSASIASGR